eukprot:CAMPEP_0182459436 /NCGR_PEP_ID=MMETSP1319-20130603/4568_1 /TAXON_ID=172717 /ORGANISM="Bolidomonas pacifica, Strain RCC208" /LENGTH=339 /DNA_ID=CAMNT_0024658359 /DNA_START=141 /DNA_END=1157 /DNA_ORIENTATION=+
MDHAEIPIHVSPLTTTSSTLPAPHYYELTTLRIEESSPLHSSHPSTPSIPGSPPSLLKRLKPTLQTLKFTNYFTASVTIRQLQKRRIPAPPPSPSSSSPNPTSSPPPPLTVLTDCWQVILQSRPLMPDPHSETGATSEFTIAVGEFDQSYYEPDSDAPLRIYLEQPSPMWKSFNLSDITLIGQIGRRRSKKLKKNGGSGSAWPPVGSAGSSLLRKLSAQRVGGGGGDHGEDLEEGDLDQAPAIECGEDVLWGASFAGDGGDHRNGGTSAMPGAVLDKLARAISDQMAMLRVEDLLQKNQASAFLSIGTVEKTAKMERPEADEGGAKRGASGIGAGANDR